MPYVIGIAGGSASGKTTLAQALARQLAPRTVEIISADRFFRRGEPGAPTFVSPTTGLGEFECNVPESVDNVRLIAAVRQLSENPHEPDVVIVEGHMLLDNSETRAMCDLKIYVELDADVRALRRMLRDLTGVRGNADPSFIARYYLESARVGHEKYVEPSRVHADFIVRGDADYERLATLIAPIAQVNTK
jgi:uridine kinase